MTRRAANESGQIFGITVVCMVAMLALAALVIDVGKLFYTHRSLQASADAAALAGAQRLPLATAAIAQANQYSGSAGQKNARANVPGVSTTVSVECRVGEYCAPVNAIAVEQKATVGANFAKVIGFDSFEIKARAVAQVVPDPMPWAIYSAESDCSAQGLLINGSNINVDGASTTNGRHKSNGSTQTFDYLSYGGPNGCSQATDGSGITYGGKSTPTFDSLLKPWPVWYTTADFSCTYTASSFKFDIKGQTIPEGTYCTSGKFEINNDDISGKITVVAYEIVVNGSNTSLEPYEGGVLFFNTSNKELILNGLAFNWTGTIFSPLGRIKINGYNNAVLTGMIAGSEVEINGDSFSVVGTGPTGAKRKIKLVE